jgi:hypothetical protein
MSTVNSAGGGIALIAGTARMSPSFIIPSFEEGSWIFFIQKRMYSMFRAAAVAPPRRLSTAAGRLEGEGATYRMYARADADPRGAVLEQHRAPSSVEVGNAGAAARAPEMERAELQKIENERRRKRRYRQTDLVAQLDELLPSSKRRTLSKNGAGVRRSMGTGGRTLHDILQDALCLVRGIRSPDPGPASCSDASRPAHPSVNGADDAPALRPRSFTAPMREALLTARGVMLVEVDVLTQSIGAMSVGARDFFACSPFGGVDGFNVKLLLHTDDIASFDSACENLPMWEEVARAQGAAEPPPHPTVKLRVVHFFKKPRFDGRRCDGGDGWAAGAEGLLPANLLGSCLPAFDDELLLSSDARASARQQSADDNIWCAAEYVSFEFQVFALMDSGHAQTKKGRVKVREMPGKIVLMAPLHTAVPPVHCCVGRANSAGGSRPPCRHARPVNDQGLEMMHRLSGQFMYTPSPHGTHHAVCKLSGPANSLGQGCSWNRTS